MSMLRNATRSKILKTALEIVKNDGWPGLSMRRIAEKINYTPPVIYDHFEGKDAIITELTANGFRKLYAAIKKARALSLPAHQRLEAMWKAYWNFAVSNQELYRSMYGVEVSCSAMKEGFHKATEIPGLFGEVIREILPGETASDELVGAKYYMFWSTVHGLIAINLVHKGMSDQINQIVLHEALRAQLAMVNA
ncbi:transcriptional regulator, TetR family [Dyadobacter soli]|uniref:Transcriptional regulator, TetR family n=1 Tax=Dyadobacter soli TaxID=659014 RepID=A0A1G7ABE4_9BACT|nr:TetR/AcrR family transcriptional regulator [Dyadobacter soli]SDE12278.1 transcriptional regulator, TetR family [Dyadobacter soli]